MKKYLVLVSFIFCMYSVLCAQVNDSLQENKEQEEVQIYDNAADSIYLKCLHEHRHFISTNALQFIVGTINLNYEFRVANQYALKIGGGTVLGYRILVNKHITVADGAHYFLIEPRFYSYSSTQNCWMQMGIAVSYKYWDYIHKIQEEGQDGYTSKEIEQHMFGASIIGKHPVSAGFTFEYQLGVDVGSLDNDTYISPNLGFSLGWTL
ncbi:MAG: DUF3575 domain-containing protein [Bacteroidales bacterium]